MLSEPSTHIQSDTRLQKLLESRAMQIVLAGMFYLIKRLSWCEGAVVPAGPSPEVSRHKQRLHERDVRRERFPIARDCTPLRALLPKGLSPTQFLERCTRLSVMGRFQIYNFLYYRWEFWRLGAIAKRCQMPRGAFASAVRLRPCGLTPAHIAPD